ncbi:MULTISPECIES: winged helix-turn-helix domain-containing protein [Halobacterium]|uniref:helix-turn-helix transcriptional regulator n=1 Tax=Halobacterium TaxID=2239 RepID=UPI00073E90C8|nr:MULTISPECIES: helix-turn-helix domain-containing protein [Halobacterium]MCG1003741.1 helix-turn-helix domain-containing protein [Halobacterium noricense]
MGVDRDEADVLRTAISRQRVFRVFEDGGATRSDVQMALDVSRSTAHRVVKTFESLGIVERQNGSYELTPFGRVVQEETERATSTLRVARMLAPLLSTLKATDEPPDLHAFEGATVTEPEAGDPYRPIRRLLTLVTESSRIREFAPTTPDPAYQRTLYDRVQAELQAEILYPATVVDHLRRESADALERAIDDGSLDVCVGDPPAFRLVIADKRVYLGGYNEEASQLQIVADTADDNAVEWATRCFENHWERATPYDAYLDGKQ